MTRVDRLEALAAYGILDTPAEEGFEDAVRLASRLCDTPVALVSLVAAERQWFKARVGFPRCETDLDASVCKFALTTPDLLIIPDLTQDDRTRTNTLVTGEPHIRFYAGAPLRTPEGHVLGSLCVIDTVPRPAGLTVDQAQDLRALSRQVVGLMELRVGRARLAASEKHWRDLFTQMQEGFFTGEIIRDARGQATDVRFVEVNPAFERQTGLPPHTAGRTMREVVPGVQHWLIDTYARVVATGEPATFEINSPALDRVFEVRARKEGEQRFAALFLDITARKQAETRLIATAELGDRLRDVRDVAAIGLIVGDVLGRALGLAHAGYGSIDPLREVVTLAPGWTARDLPALAGVHRLGDHGAYVEDLERGDAVLIADVARDPRTAATAANLATLGVRALANLPIVEGGRLVAVVFALKGEPHAWTPEEAAFLRDVAGRARAAVARLEAEAQRHVINQELSHRLKNTLAMVQSIATQTLRNVVDREPVDAFERRIHALASAHEVLLREDWSDAPLGAVARTVLGTFEHANRFTLSGPDLPLGPRATMSLSLLLHELATNAAKYGALSTEAGRVAVTWRVEDTHGGPEVVLDWEESGGPPPRPSNRTGFGSRLIRLGLTGTGGVELRYPSSGFRAEMRAPFAQLQQS